MNTKILAVIFLAIGLAVGGVMFFMPKTKQAPSVLSYVSSDSPLVVSNTIENDKKANFYDAYLKSIIEQATSSGDTTPYDAQIKEVVDLAIKFLQDAKIKSASYALYLSDLRPVFRIVLKDEQATLKYLKSRQDFTANTIKDKEYLSFVLPQNPNIKIIVFVDNSQLVVTLDAQMAFYGKLEDALGITKPAKSFEMTEFKKRNIPTKDGFVFLDLVSLTNSMLKHPMLQMAIKKECADDALRIVKNLVPMMLYGGKLDLLSDKRASFENKGMLVVSNANIKNTFKQNKGRAVVGTDKDSLSISFAISHKAIWASIEEFKNILSKSSCKELQQAYVSFKDVDVSDYMFFEGLSFIVKNIGEDFSNPQGMVHLSTDDFDKLSKVIQPLIAQIGIDLSTLQDKQELDTPFGAKLKKDSNDLILYKNYETGAIKNVTNFATMQGNMDVFYQNIPQDKNIYESYSSHSNMTDDGLETQEKGIINLEKK